MIQYVAVLPAYAGMFPACSTSRSAGACSPRVCGDVSLPTVTTAVSIGFSPRMRGCFWGADYAVAEMTVLPAYAGMFLSLETS